LKKRSIVEFWRIMATLVILWHHVYTVKTADLDPFRDGWIFVEFFFILTGFFTMSHFAYVHPKNMNEAAANAIKYTIKKFSRFLPYVAIPLVASFVCAVYFHEATMDTVQSLVLDVSFLGANIWGRYTPNIPLWYLATMFAVFPLFSLLCQTKSKNVLYLFASLFVIIWYGRSNYLSNTIAPQSIIRAFAGLMLGAITYGISTYLSNCNFSRKKRIGLTVLEALCIAGVFVGSFFNANTVYLYMMCFVIGTAIMLSDVTYTKYIHIGIIDQMGDLALAIYTWQWFIGAYLVWKISAHFGISNMEMLYYVCTFICALGTWMLIKTVQCIWHKTHKKLGNTV